jgi:large subunit ribosomal protein L30
MTRLAITLRKSVIGYSRSQRRTVDALGLRRLNHTVEHEDTPSVRGALHKLRHLLEVREVED